MAPPDGRPKASSPVSPGFEMGRGSRGTGLFCCLASATACFQSARSFSCFAKSFGYLFAASCLIMACHAVSEGFAFIPDAKVQVSPWPDGECTPAGPGRSRTQWREQQKEDEKCQPADTLQKPTTHKNENKENKKQHHLQSAHPLPPV